MGQCSPQPVESRAQLAVHLCRTPAIAPDRRSARQRRRAHWRTVPQCPHPAHWQTVRQRPRPAHWQTHGSRSGTCSRARPHNHCFTPLTYPPHLQMTRFPRPATWPRLRAKLQSPVSEALFAPHSASPASGRDNRQPRSHAGLLTKVNGMGGRREGNLTTVRVVITHIGRPDGAPHMIAALAPRVSPTLDQAGNETFC